MWKKKSKMVFIPSCRHKPVSRQVSFFFQSLPAFQFLVFSEMMIKSFPVPYLFSGTEKDLILNSLNILNEAFSLFEATDERETSPKCNVKMLFI